MKRGFSRGLLRLITLIISAVAAFFVAKAVGARVAELVMPAMQQMFASDPDFVAFLGNNPVIGQSAGALMQMLFTPILFWVLYVVFKILTLVVYWILCIFVRKTHFFAFRWVWGAAFGALAGVIGVLVFVTPVMGYTQLLSDTITETKSLNMILDYGDESV